MIKDNANYDRLLKTQDRIDKIDRLMTRVDREFKKKTTEINLGGIQKDYFRLLRQFYDVYQLCLVEVCSELKDYQLDNIGICLFKLFASFKVQMAENMKYCIDFTTKYEDSLKMFSSEANNPNIERLRRQERELRRIRENPNERDETIKRTTDSLTEGAEELFLLIEEFNKGKVEIEQLLNSRDQVKSMKDSGAHKLLQQLLKTYKNTVLNTSFDEEEEEINRHRPENKNEYFIDELTKDLIKKVKGEHRKAIENHKKKAQDKWKPTTTNVKMEDRGFQTLNEDEIDEHQNEDIFSTDVMKRKNVQLASMIERKRMAEISQKDLMHLLDEAGSKARHLEEKLKTQQKELDKVSEDFRKHEFLSVKRKDKVRALKEEVNQLNSKLNQLTNLMSSKEAELKARPTQGDIEKAKKDIKEAQEAKTYALANQSLQYEGNMISLKNEIEELKKKVAAQNSIIELLNDEDAPKEGKGKGGGRESSDFSVRRSTKDINPLISFPISEGDEIKLDSPSRKRGSTMGHQPKKIPSSKEKGKESRGSVVLRKPDKRASVEKHSLIKHALPKVEEQNELGGQISHDIAVPQAKKEEEKKDFLKEYLGEYKQNLKESAENLGIEKLIKDLVETEIPKKNELLVGINDMVQYFLTMGCLPKKNSSPRHSTISKPDVENKEVQVEIAGDLMSQKSLSSEKRRGELSNSKTNSIARTSITSPNNKEGLSMTKSSRERDVFGHYYGDSTSSKRHENSSITPMKKSNEESDSHVLSMTDSHKSLNPLTKNSFGKGFGNQSGIVSPVSQLAMKTYFGKVQESDEERKDEDLVSKTMTDLNFVRKNGKNTTPYLKIVDKEKEKEEEEGAKEIYDHIVKTGLNDQNNFAKIKHMMNYPFRSINDKFAEPSQDKQDVELSFDYFKNFYKKLLDIHRKCGTNCTHLQRFYKKIGYIRGPGIKKEFSVSKQIVDKLPKIFV